MPNVLLSTNTMGAEIRYTTDGNDVTEESTLYSGQFSVEAGATVKAKAFKSGMNPSPQSTLQSLPKLQTPTISLTRSGSTINITIGNTVEGATYRYKVGSAPTGPTDGTAITGSATLDNSSALTIYVVGWKTGTYNPSDTAMDSVAQYVPTLQTPTLSLTRDGSTVNGTIGNTVSGATYVYKIGSSPSSQSDGTVISGTTFSFSNSNAVTVYVRGFMSGYNPSNAVSKSVESDIVPPFDSWTTIINPTSDNQIPRSIAYGNGVYVLSLAGNNIYISNNLTDWRQITRGDLTTGKVIFGNGVFLILSSRTVLRSTDSGNTWTEISQYRDVSDADFILFANGRFYAFVDRTKVYISSDGNTWEEHNYNVTVDMPSYGCGVAYYNGYFYCLANNYETYNYSIMRSSNGYDWTKIGNDLSTESYSYNLLGVINNRIVIRRKMSGSAGNSCDVGSIGLSSFDEEWVTGTYSATQLDDTTATDGVFLAICLGSPDAKNYIYTKDGINFYPMENIPDVDTYGFNIIGCANDKFFLCYNSAPYYIVRTL